MEFIKYSKLVMQERSSQIFPQILILNKLIHGSIFKSSVIDWKKQKKKTKEENEINSLQKVNEMKEKSKQINECRSCFCYNTGQEIPQCMFHLLRLKTKVLTVANSHETRSRLNTR